MGRFGITKVTTLIFEITHAIINFIPRKGVNFAAEL